MAERPKLAAGGGDVGPAEHGQDHAQAGLSVMGEAGMWEAYAVRYASLASHTRRGSFLGLDAHDDLPNTVDYYVWVVRDATRCFVIDTAWTRRRRRAVAGC